MKQSCKRILSIILILVMAVSMLPLQVLAAEQDEIAGSGSSFAAASAAEDVPSDPASGPEPAETEPGEFTLSPSDPPSTQTPEGAEEKPAAAVLSGETEPLTSDSTSDGTSCGENASWSFEEASGTLTIQGTGAMTEFASATAAPWHSQVTAIKRIVVEDSITGIGSFSFYGANNLKTVSLPASVCSLGRAAFYGCSSLEAVSLPDGITSIGYQCFANCTNLRSINLPRSWTDCPSTNGTIDTDHCGHIFQGCKALTTLTVPDGLTIPSYGLCYSDYLEQIVFEGSTGAIKNHTFYSCSKLKSIEVPDNVTSIGKSAFCYCPALEDVRLPDGLTTLAPFSFYSCTSLKSVKLPDSITSIGWKCFADSTSLSSINLPRSWTDCPSTDSTIDTDHCGHIFQGCKALTTLTVPDGLTIPSFGLCYSDYLEQIVFEGSTGAIKNHTFYGCSRLKRAQIPDNVASIGKSAFCNCSALETVQLPDGLTTLMLYSFYNCSSLVSVTLPDSITSIGWKCFADSTSLSSINLPRSWTDCPSADGKTIDTDHCGHIFEGCKALTTLTVPDGLTIPSFGLCGSDYLVTVNLPDTVTEIKNHTFYGCSKLENVNIPKTVTSIGRSAFCNCKSIESIKIPDGVTSIISYTFQNCAALKNLSIPSSVQTINAYAFDGCSSLQTVTIPDSVTGIGYYAFANCTNLRDVTLSKNWTSCISSNASYTGTSYQGSIFYGCTSLLTLKVPDGVTAIPSYAFSNCKQLRSVSLPKSLKTIPAYAFYGCSNMLLIQIPEAVTSVEKYAFYGCSSVEVINICDSLQSVDSNAFSGVSSNAVINYAGDASAWDAVSIQSSGNTVLTQSSVQYSQTIDETYGAVRPASLGNCFYSSPSGISFTNFYGGYVDSSSHSLIDVNDAFFGKDAYRRFVSVPKDSYLTLRFQNVVYFEGDSKLYLTTTGIVNERADFYAVLENGDLEYLFTVTEDKENHVLQLPKLNNGVIGLKIVGKDLDGDSPGFDVVDLFLLTHETQKEADFKSKTTAAMMRGGDTYNLLAEEQSFEKGSEEAVTFIITPDWQDHTPGYITLSQRGKTILKNAGGTFVDERPGMIFSPLESIYATLFDADGNIVESLKLKLRIDAAVSNRLTVSANQITVTVYENKNDSSSQSDRYVFSAGAAISADGADYTTNRSGVAVIPALKGASITVSKDGFVTRTITAAQLEESACVYLQPKSSDAPVVSAVWIENTDILQQAYAVGLLSDQSTTITAEVSWGGSSYGGIALMQDARTVKFTGDKLTTVLKDNFDVSKPIYIVATDAVGRTTKKALKFSAAEVSGIPDELNGFGFDLDGLSFTLPDSAPFFLAGKKLKFGVDSPIPITITTENGKIYAAIGLDLWNYSKTSKWSTKTKTSNVAVKRETKLFIDQFKDCFKSAADSAKKLASLKKTYKNAMEMPRASFGYEADFIILGFWEGYLDSQGELCTLDSGVIANPSFALKYSYPFSVGPVPMFFDASFSADVKGIWNLYISESAKAFTPNGELSGDITLSGGVGLGLKKVLSASGGLDGKLSPYWRIYANAQDYFRLTASVNFYAKVEIAFFEYKYPFEPFYNEVWYEYPKASALMSGTAAEAAGFYNAARYTVKDLSYLNGASAFTANRADGGAALMSISPQQPYLTSSTLKTNIYRESTPQYVQMANGTALAVWLDGAGSNINAIQLYYSYYNGSAWSEPAAVSNDGTLDYTPYMTLIGDVPYLVWQNAVKTFSTSDTLETIAPYFDIAVARFEPGTGFTAQTIPNSGLDMLPTICGSGASVYAAWVHNGQNDWFGNNDQNSILYSELSGGVWSEPVTAYSGLSSIDALAADLNGELRLAYAMDTDGKIATAEDVRVFENGVRVTSADSPETFPVYHDHTLFWNSNGAVIAGAGETQNEVQNVGGYQLLDVMGEKAMVYTTSNGLASVLNISYYNRETEQWAEPLKLTDGSSYIGAFSAAVRNDDTISILCSEQTVVGDYTDDDPYGTSALSMLTLAPYCDLAMGELTYSADAYSAGADMEIGFALTNNGSRVIDSVSVTTKDENGSVLSEIIVDDVIVPGQTIEAATYFPVAQTASGQTVTITAVPTACTDVNGADNTRTAALAFEDLSVENAVCGLTADNRVSISASIVNRGYTTRSNIVVELRKGQSDGEIAASETIASLSPLSLAAVSFTAADRNCDVYYIVLKDSGDEFTANDAEFVSLADIKEAWSFAEIGSVTETGAQIVLSNAEAGTCVVAVYDENGRVLAAGSKAVKAEAGTVEISYSRISLPARCTVKVFFVDSGWKPVYKAVTKEF